MTPKTSTLGFASILAIVALASSAPAQTRAAAAPAATPIAQGPAIPGLCILSVNQAVGSSTVGQYMQTRLTQIIAQVRAELTPEGNAINTEGKALDAARPTLAQAAFQSRATALSARIDALRQKNDLREREVKATQEKAFNRIAQELQPIAQQLYQQKHCSVLVDKGSTMAFNPEMDITPQVIAGLNAKIQQFAFDREHLDTGAAATSH